MSSMWKASRVTLPTDRFGLFTIPTLGFEQAPVVRDKFELNITERGEVEAFDVTEVRSLVKSNNTTGNAILRIVPEGTTVKKGDGEYKVTKGDTLSTIAADHDVKGGWEKLFELNKDIVQDADLIYPGQVLVLPRARD